MAAVVELRTQLRKGGGGELTGRCPFHDERTPSFWLNPVKQLYYCFGCGAKGDLISFVRETEGLDFAEAGRGAEAARAAVRRARAGGVLLRAVSLGLAGGVDGA